MGDLTVVAATTAGFFLATFNYLWPETGIHGTDGALMVIGSTILILGAALVVSFRQDGRSALMTTLGILIVLGIIGTAFVAYLLEATVLLTLMVIALLGALVRLALSATKDVRPHTSSAAGRG